jgi:NADPH:quinone reductase-like Zn-dependent oxidoreductase
LKELGVDQPINYEKTRFEDVVHDVDVVLDSLGGETQARSWKVLKPGGILISILSQPSAEQAKAHGVRTGYLFAQPNPAHLAEIAQFVDAGKVQAVAETVFPLANARRAHELSQTGHVRGKIVLRVI